MNRKKALKYLSALLTIGMISAGTVFAENHFSTPQNVLEARAENSCVEWDAESGTLYLQGVVEKEQVLEYSKNNDVTSVIARKGTVFPADSSEMFYYFLNTKKIDVSQADFSNVEDLSQFFYGCYNLNTIDFGEINTPKLKTVEKMFTMCFEITNIDLSKFETQNLVSMKSLFWGCSKLEEVNFAGWDTAGVTDMSHLFFGCTRLKAVDLSHFDTHAVTTMSSMFQDCPTLEVLDLRNFNTANVENIVSMFRGCSALKTIYVSHLWQKCPGSYVFEGCTSLVGGNGTTYDEKNISSYYARIDSKSATGKPGYFTGTEESLVEFDEENATLHLYGYIDADEVKGYAENESVHYVVAEKGCYFPPNCYALFEKFRAEAMDLHLADTSEVTSMEDMFVDCYSLKRLYINGWDTSKVATMKWMFHNCCSLYSLDLRSFDTSNVLNMTFMFARCSSLYQISVSDLWNTEMVLESNQMFLGDNQLTGEQGTVYSYDTDSLEYAVIDGKDGKPGYFSEQPYVEYHTGNKSLILRGAFQKEEVRCYAGTDLVRVVIAEMDTIFPEDCSLLFSQFDATYIDIAFTDTSKVTTMQGMFKDCEKLTTIELEGVDTSSVVNMSQMFQGCKSLVSVELTSFQTNHVQNFSYMFASCERLSSLNLSNFDTGSAISFTGFFMECSKLETIRVSNFFKKNKIERDQKMFEGCINLVGGNGTPFDANATDATYARIDGKAGKIGYFTADNWITMGDLSEDGFIDSDDSVLCLKKANADMMEMEDPIFEELDLDTSAGDVNGDGVIDSDDCVLIMKYANAVMMGEELPF